MSCEAMPYMTSRAVLNRRTRGLRDSSGICVLVTPRPSSWFTPRASSGFTPRPSSWFTPRASSGLHPVQVELLIFERMPLAEDAALPHRQHLQDIGYKP